MLDELCRRHYRREDAVPAVLAANPGLAAAAAVLPAGLEIELPDLPPPRCRRPTRTGHPPATRPRRGSARCSAGRGPEASCCLRAGPAWGPTRPSSLRGGAGVDAVWVATQVRQALTADGYRTHLDIEAVTEPWQRTAAQQLPEAPFGAAPAASREPPDLRHVVERVAAEHPAELRDARDTSAFVDLAVPALRAADGPRWGHRQEAGGAVSTGSVAYYQPPGAPVEGSGDIAVIDIVGGVAPVVPAWERAATAGSWTA